MFIYVHLPLPFTGIFGFAHWEFPVNVTKDNKSRWYSAQKDIIMWKCNQMKSFADKKEIMRKGSNLLKTWWWVGGWVILCMMHYCILELQKGTHCRVSELQKLEDSALCTTPPHPPNKLRSVHCVQVSHTYGFCNYTTSKKCQNWTNSHPIILFCNYALQLLQSRHRSYITHTNLIKLHQKSSRRTHDQIDFSDIRILDPKHRIHQLAASFQIPKTDVEISYCECYKIRSYPLDRPGVIREILDRCYSFSAPCITIMQSYDFSTYVGIFSGKVSILIPLYKISNYVSQSVQ